MKGHPLHSCVFGTELGFFGIAWNETGLARVILPERARSTAESRIAGYGAADDAPPGFISRLIAEIRLYAAGEPVGFDWVPADLAPLDAFERDILAATRQLGFGKTTTYGALAEAAGHPGMARETGTALGRNPVPLVIPCHRVLAAGGAIGGFSAPGGIVTKRRLLAHERATLPGANPAQASFLF